MAHPRIAALATANPAAQFSQKELLAFSPYTDERRRGFFLRSGIERRHLYLDRATFRPTETTDELSARYRAGSIEIGRGAIRRALDLAVRSAQEIDFLATTSCTGRLCPGLERAQRAMRLSDDDLAFSRGVLRQYGNMSSATALFVLNEVVKSGQASPGDLGLMIALGPGFCAEGALLRW